LFQRCFVQNQGDEKNPKQAFLEIFKYFCLKERCVKIKLFLFKDLLQELVFFTQMFGVIVGGALSSPPHHLPPPIL